MSACRRCAAEPVPTGPIHGFEALADRTTWSPRRCAFASGVFDTDNWNCATVNLLRDAAESMGWSAYEKDGIVRTFSGDQMAALLPVPEGDEPGGEGDFIVLGWYKRRGRTEYAGVIYGTEAHPLSLDVAEAYLARHADEGVQGDLLNEGGERDE